MRRGLFARHGIAWHGLHFSCGTAFYFSFWSAWDGPGGGLGLCLNGVSIRLLRCDESRRRAVQWNFIPTFHPELFSFRRLGATAPIVPRDSARPPRAPRGAASHRTSDTRASSGRRRRVEGTCAAEKGGGGGRTPRPAASEADQTSRHVGRGSVRSTSVHFHPSVYVIYMTNHAKRAVVVRHDGRRPAACVRAQGRVVRDCDARRVGRGGIAMRRHGGRVEREKEKEKRAVVDIVGNYMRVGRPCSSRRRRRRGPVCCGASPGVHV